MPLRPTSPLGSRLDARAYTIVRSRPAGEQPLQAWDAGHLHHCVAQDVLHGVSTSQVPATPLCAVQERRKKRKEENIVFTGGIYVSVHVNS